ncbi:MAG: ABC transporter ATP-binding protein, partial [Bacteroidia bacterium]|nr:ABC transporter ATP-binding protein [Bacteroidia bacterium]
MSITGKALDWQLLKRVFQYIKPFKRVFYLTVFLTVVLAVLAPLRPWIIQVILDKYIALGDYMGLVQMTFILVALLVTQSIIQFVYTFRTNWLGQKVVNALRVRLFKHIIHFRLPYFDKTAIGTPVTRVVSDMETVGSIFSNGIITIISDILQMTGVLIFMFYIDWQLALMVLLPIPVLVVATNIFKNKIRKVFTDVRDKVSELNVFVQEHLTGMRIVQIFNREQQEMDKFKKINEQHREAHIRSVWYYSIFFPVVEILSATSIALLIWWGAKGVIADRLTVGILVEFLLFLYMLFRPIRELADKFNTLQMGMVG